MEVKEIISEKSLALLRNEMEIKPEQITEKLTNFISEYMVKLKRTGVIFGLSGGLDSAVVAALCALAVGPEKTLALLMPEKDSKKEHLIDAQEVVRELKIKSKEIDITGYLKKLGIYRLFPLDHYVPRRYRAKLVRIGTRYMVKQWGSYFSRTLLGCDSGLQGIIINRAFTYYRAKHRMRMVILYMHGEMENRLVIGAANKTEFQIGYFVKHGIDAATDIMPIMNLYKTQVISLAKYLKVPAHIIDKAPSPDIIPGVIDETAIGLPYEKLDFILLAIEKGWTDEEMENAFSEIEITNANIEYVRELMKQSGHMRTIYVAD